LTHIEVRSKMDMSHNCKGSIEEFFDSILYFHAEIKGSHQFIFA
jgi:hypothetical protein